MPKQIVDLRKKKPIPEISSSSRTDSRSSKDISRKKTKRIRVVPRDYPRKSASINKIEWVAPEFTKYKKDKRWFVLPALAALVIIIAAFLLKNFLLVVLIILSAFVIYIYALKEPRKIKFGISGKGVQIDKRLYGFENLKSFWIFYDPPEIKEISLQSGKTFIPYIRVPLGKQNPVEIRRLLLKFLPEKPHKESRIDEFARKNRF